MPEQAPDGSRVGRVYLSMSRRSRGLTFSEHIIMKKPGISNRESADEEARDRASHPPLTPPARETEPHPAEVNREGADENLQTAQKEGVRSGAQKAATSRHGDQPQPAANKKPGASGREGARDLKRRVH